MKNCLIMGFGRSGTSLMGGILHQVGYYMGEELYPPRNTNPKGFFENAIINDINERILSKYDFGVMHNDAPTFKKIFSPYNPGTGQRWLTYITKDVDINTLDELSKNEIKKAISVEGYAYKDPRFNYTLGIWNRFVDTDTIYICVFRQPDIVVESVITECNTSDYLSNFYINREIAFKLWFNSYSHLLINLNSALLRRTVFVNYEQLLSGEALDLLSVKLDVNIDSSFVEPKLNRSKPGIGMPPEVSRLYNKLCGLAGYINNLK